MDHTTNNHTTKFHKAHGRHWHHLYNRRRQRVLGISASQMALTQVVSLVGSIAAGVHLEENKAILALITGTFVIMPGVFDLDGSLGAALSAKINHRLEDPDARGFRVLLSSVGFALVIALLAGMLVGFVGGGMAAYLFDAEFGQIFQLSLAAIMLSAVIGFPIIGLLSLFFRKIKVNPDDVVGPIESAFFDVLTVVTLVWVVGWLV